MDKSYEEKEARRAQEKLKLLLNRADFQDAIINLRLKWNIPKEGFDSHAKIEKWYSELEEKNELFYKNKWPQYAKELAKLKKNNDFIELEDKSVEYQYRIPTNAFNKDIIDLSVKFGIYSEVWRVFVVQAYLFSGKKRKIIPPIGKIKITTQIDEQKGHKQILVALEADATHEDIKRILRDSKPMTVQVYGAHRKKTQTIKNFTLYKRANKLKMEGKKPAEIADKLGTSKRHLDDSDIYEFLRRYKEISGMK